MELTLLTMGAEVLGGIGFVLGPLTRLAAFGTYAGMAVAIVMDHLKSSFFLN